MLTDRPSVFVRRRQAAMTPVKMPNTIAKAVPSVTIGRVLIRAMRRFVETGCWF